MKKSKLTYESPLMEELQVETERVFADSGFNNPEDMDTDDWGWGNNL